MVEVGVSLQCCHISTRLHGDSSQSTKPRYSYILSCSMLSETKEIKYVSRIKIYTINVNGGYRKLEGDTESFRTKNLQQAFHRYTTSISQIHNKHFTDTQQAFHRCTTSISQMHNKHFTDAQDKQLLALGRRASSFGCMNCVTFASEFCLI